MSITPWKTLASTHPRKNLRVDQCELPNGRRIETMILEFADWATVVALTSDEQVILIKQYRHGVGQIIWEIPGGSIDPGESPLHAAGRELLEETGYAAGSLVALTTLSPNPDNHTNHIHIFLALDVQKVAAQALDANEEIEVYPVPLPDVIRMTQNGELPQAMHVSALFLALAHLRRLS